MRVVVTGGAGFLGSHRCERLIAEGHAVVCLDDLSTGRLRNIDSARTPPTQELLGQRQLGRPEKRVRRGNAVCRGANGRLRAIRGPERRDRPHRQHLRTTDAGARRTGRLDVHPSGTARGAPANFGDGSQTRSFCFVSELVAGLLAMMTSDNCGPINLGNPVQRPVTEQAERVISRTKSSSTIKYLPLPIDDPTRRPDLGRAASLGWAPRSVSMKAALGTSSEEKR